MQRVQADFGSGRPLQLHNGKAWLQFCLVDEQNMLIASKSRWVTVKGAPKGDGYGGGVPVFLQPVDPGYGGPVLTQDPGYSPVPTF